MDVNYAHGTSRLVGTMLALAVACRSAAADEAAIQLQDPRSRLVITASDSDHGLQQPAAAEGSELVVHDSDDDQSRAAANQPTSAAQATLSVVANAQRQQPLAAVMFDPDVTPAAVTPIQGRTRQGRSWGNMMSQAGGPTRPSAAAGIQTRPYRNRTASQAAADDAPRAPRTKIAASPADSASRQQQAAAASPTSQPADAASQLLLRAYELSLTAAGETEYSQVVRGCAEAMRHGLEGENRQFALELSAWALNRRGQARSDQGQQELAIADFRAALEFDPRCWRALHNRGVTLAQNGQFAEAFDDICKVIEINPQFAKAFSNRATLYVQAGEFDKAIAEYETALRLDPVLLPALVGHGRVCHMVGRLEEALESFNAAVAQEGENAEVVCSRADLLVDLGRYSDALEDYARAIDLDSKFEHAYRNGAWLLATCPDDSIRDADGALKGARAALDCGYGERHAALDTLAAALANAGRFEEAVHTIQQAIEIAPEEARPAYQARQQLYELRQPFRTHPVNLVQTAEFVEG